jgi:hypothetical protein
MKSNQEYLFSQVPQVEIPRSVFNRSHEHKTTFRAGYLIPIYVDEALPGDTFTLRHNIFTRLATPIKPIMDNLKMDIHYFTVPLRLIHENFKKMMGEQKDPNSSIDFRTPIINRDTQDTQEQSISDYFGIPIHVSGLEVCSYWHRAYNLIYNTHYRDQNMLGSVPENIDDGPDDPDDYVLLKRCKRHDYFTSCLPAPQRGPGIMLPLGQTAPVHGDGHTLGLTQGAENFGMLGVASDGKLIGDISQYNQTIPHAVGIANLAGTGYGVGVVGASGVSGLVADLQNATAATINSLRMAFQLQKMLERDARGGTRYVESVKSHFGVTSPDARQQRPEILGVSTLDINVNPVVKMSSTDSTSPQGNLAAYGTGHGHGNGFTFSFTEHSVILGIASVRADLTYQQGLPRMFSRRTRYDFYWPALAHIGEQAVLRKEIYADGVDADDNTVFGYQERFAEYRYFPSKITGYFRSAATNSLGGSASLDVWHLSQSFVAPPTLNYQFIEENPPIDRVIAVPGTQNDPAPHFLFDSFFELKCARPMPVYSVPGLIDHF